MFSHETFIRFFDILLAILLFIFLLPFFLIIGLVIKIDTPGHFLYQQERVGKNGKTFMILKFRTMNHSPSDIVPQYRRDSKGKIEPVIKVRNDSRVTHIGSFLRKYSIDELPQLFNIIKGDMSLVGPRPTIPEEAARYTAHQRKRLAGKPGLTGLAQIKGRSDLDFGDILKYDLQYIENTSFGLYLRILFLTIPCLFTGRSSY